jgi:hypothetical protein
MKIISLVAENFKKLKAIEIKPVGNIVEITGKCEQGKTTVLDAISAALCGTKWDEPIRMGEEKGKVVVDLGDKIVTRTFTKAGGALKVESKDGAKYPRPQVLLDKMVGKIAFDPLQFAKADPKKQVEMLLSVVDIKVDTERLKEISGVVVSETPNPLDMLNAAYKAVFEDRTAVNRQADAAVKTLGSLAKVERVEAVLLTELVAERDKLEWVNRDNNDYRERLENYSKKVDEMETDSNFINSEVTRLTKLLLTEKTKLSAKNNEIIKDRENIIDMTDDAAKLKDLPLDDVNARIAKADTTNKQAQQYLDYQAKQTESERLTAEAADLTLKIEAIKKYKTEIISNTKFPVPGLDFAGGGVIFDEKPFSQASKAQQMRVGIGIGMSANPDLRVIMLDGYESLDSDQRAIVEEMAAEHDFQVWCVSVNSSGTVGIYIEDGEIVSTNV